MTPNTRLACVVPPHMVEAVRINGSDEQRAQVEALIQLSNQMRGKRTDAPRTAPEYPEAVTSVLTSVTAEAPAPPQILVFDMVGDGDPSLLPGSLVRSDTKPSGDADVDRAWDFAQETWTLFANEFDRNSLDDDGMPIVSSVHFGVNFNNAFWNGSQMAYGDGDGVLFNPFTSSLSVVAHELAHGVVQFSGGLVYQDQSGALNEHVADVFGVLAEQRQAGQQARQASWLIGEGLIREPNSALRSMAEPGTAYDHSVLGSDPQPYHMDGFVATSMDHGGVHINSGIPNHAFYLAAMMHGGSAWDDIGHVWYQALQSLNNPLAQFGDFADETTRTAINLHGAGSRQARLVSRAWKLVGVQ
jgi:Zn-dependent metalloprotease